MLRLDADTCQSSGAGKSAMPVKTSSCHASMPCKVVLLMYCISQALKKEVHVINCKDMDVLGVQTVLLENVKPTGVGRPRLPPQMRSATNAKLAFCLVKQNEIVA